MPKLRDLGEDEINRILKEGPELLAAQIRGRKKIRDLWKKDAKEVLDGHWLTLSVIADLIKSKSGVLGKSSPDLAKRLSLTASFVQGIDACETCISEGLYLQAAALLKQEMETIAAVQEVKSGTRKNRTTPNVRGLPFRLAQMYGELNKAAHVADEDLLENLLSHRVSDEITGAPIIPRYDKDLASQLYTLHILLTWLDASEIIEIFAELYGHQLSDLHAGMLNRTIRILQDAGYIRIDEQLFR